MAQVARTPRRYKYSRDKNALLARLKRVEGQARGVQRMLEGDRYCVDVVQQLNAISAAVDEVALIVLQNHIEGCVSDAIKEGAGEECIGELMDVMRRAIGR